MASNDGITGDDKQNFLDLQQSTGESFEHMAQRMTDDNVMRGLDDAGKNRNNALAKWLRTQKDDQEAIERVTYGEEGKEAFEKRVAAEQRAAGNEPNKGPQGRTTPAGARQNG